MAGDHETDSHAPTESTSRTNSKEPPHHGKKHMRRSQTEDTGMTGHTSHSHSRAGSKPHGRAGSKPHGRAGSKTKKHDEGFERQTSNDTSRTGSKGRPTKGHPKDQVIEEEEEEDFSDDEELDWRSLNKVALQLLRRCCRATRTAKGHAIVAIKREVHEGWGKTSTAQSLAKLPKMRRKDFVKAADQSFTKTWRKFFGKPKQKQKKLTTTQQLAAEVNDDDFGVHKFIIHNPGRIEDFFEIEEVELAFGGSAKVFRGKERATHIDRAIKQINKEQNADFAKLVKEVSIMKQLDHPNIVKLFETFEDERNLYLVLEICEGGDVLDRLLQKKQMAEHHVAIIIRTVLMTMNYLHQNGVCHRDIKPENVLFKDSHPDVRTAQLRLVDFGYACRIPEADGMMHTKVGSLYYMAPEILNCEKYSPACDTWSIGVVCYMLLGGYPPFGGASDAETMNQIKRGKFYFHPKTWNRVSKPAKHLIRRLLEVDVDKRMTIPAALEHQWIKSRGVVRVQRMREGTVDHLITFHQYHRLRRSAMLAVSYQLDGPEVRALLELFQALDLNGDGLLTTSEFKQAVMAIAEVEDSFIDQMMTSVDADGSGIIDFTEFLAATLENEMFIRNHAAILRAFRSFDQDDSGGLSIDEVAETLCMDPEAEAEELNQFFTQVDVNQDGVMDYGEFFGMLQSEITIERRVSVGLLESGRSSRRSRSEEDPEDLDAQKGALGPADDESLGGSGGEEDATDSARARKAERKAAKQVGGSARKGSPKGSSRSDKGSAKGRASGLSKESSVLASSGLASSEESEPAAASSDESSGSESS